MTTAILVDSSACLPEELANHPDVYEVCLTVNFANGDTMKDSSKPADVEYFYGRLSQEKELPTTSQPTPGDYFTVLDEIVAKGYENVLAVHLSKEISGTFHASELSLAEYADRLNVSVVNSRAASVIIQRIVEQSLELFEKGYPFEEVSRHAHWSAENSRVFLMVEDLQNLVTGGRLSAAGAFIGSMLRVRPHIRFTSEGSLEVFEKLRTNRRVYRRWAELIKEQMDNYPQGVDVLFAHAHDEEGIEEAIALIKKELPDIEPGTRSMLGPLIGVHLGKGGKGVGLIPRLDLEE